MTNAMNSTLSMFISLFLKSLRHSGPPRRDSS
jgi:hypothetical protein